MRGTTVAIAVSRHITPEQAVVLRAHAQISYEMPWNEAHVGIYAVIHDATVESIEQFQRARRAVALGITVRYFCTALRHHCLDVNAPWVWDHLGVHHAPRRGVFQQIGHEGPVFIGMRFNNQTFVLYAEQDGHVANLQDAFDFYIQRVGAYDARLAHAIAAVQ